MSVYLEPNNPVGQLSRLTFPYTPQIDYSADVKYDTYNTSHTNYQMYGYTRSENPQISLNCKFSAHTFEHFRLSEYAIRFLRTYSKMNYGRQDPQRGQTPRILRFFAYGEKIFDNVPVVISKFNMTFPDDVDYVVGRFDKDNKLIGADSVRDTRASSTQPTTFNDDIPTVVVTGRRADGFELYLPSFFQIGISLLMQPNLYKTVNEFNLEDFSAGKLSTKGYI